MAKRKKINKCQAIRDYVTAHPRSTTIQVVAALGRQQIKVSAATVSTVRSKAGLTSSGRRMSPAKTNNAAGTNDATSSQFLDKLIEAR